MRLTLLVVDISFILFEVLPGLLAIDGPTAELSPSGGTIVGFCDLSLRTRSLFRPEKVSGL